MLATTMKNQSKLEVRKSLSPEKSGPSVFWNISVSKVKATTPIAETLNTTLWMSSSKTNRRR